MVGKSEYGLEVLKDITPGALDVGKKMIDDKVISVYLKEDISEKLYIEVIARCDNNFSKIIISKEHSRFSHIELNNEVLLHISDEKTEADDHQEVFLNFDKVCEFALETPLDELLFIKEASELNKAAAAESMKGDYGHCVSHTLANGMLGNNVFTRMLSVTAAACYH